MNNPQKQTVYLPKATFPLSMKGEVGELFSLQQGYFFTPEQLNQYTANVIKQALETAAEKAKINYKEDGEVTKVKSKRLDIDYLSEVSSKVSFNINTESITNTFDETFKKLKV